MFLDNYILWKIPNEEEGSTTFARLDFLLFLSRQLEILKIFILTREYQELSALLHNTNYRSTVEALLTGLHGTEP